MDCNLELWDEINPFCEDTVSQQQEMKLAGIQTFNTVMYKVCTWEWGNHVTINKYNCQKNPASPPKQQQQQKQKTA